MAKDDSGDALGLLGTAVLGSPLDKLVIIAVLTSAAASTQTTILPTARTSLVDGARRGDARDPRRIHQRLQTPHVSTVLMGVVSIVWYVGLTLVSEDILFDSIAALGLMIAFYYGSPASPASIYYRHELTNSLKNFLFIGVAPVIGGLVCCGSSQVVRRPRQAGELGVGRLLAGARAAARHRRSACCSSAWC